MGMWQERSLIYKVGFAGANLATLMFIVAFCAPSWALFKIQPNGGHHHTQSLGLWQVCTEDLSVCKLALHSENPGWLKAVRALECIAMFFAVASCFIGLYSNCILKAQITSNIFNKNMETSAIVAVAFGAFGLIMFASQIKKYYTRFSSSAGHVWWGFVLASVATALLGLSATLMLLAHRLRLLAEVRRERGSQFAHRQFSNSSFHSNVRLPDYSESEQHANGEGGEDACTMPPAYDMVVNCGDLDSETGLRNEAPPPPYSQVVTSDTCPYTTPTCTSCPESANTTAVPLE
ncbi:hypothetical protein PoB_001133700 [Plakobranchus ocellatus]|uniref:Uncharacterized protein n=1 Tax=Plakobranchus ocellatus TaxID=259542 RepID=A0AAV3YRR6_9GAST|nr:hypothetical protein PoB_001133700 [Plakobranchus ocellatus]